MFSHIVLGVSNFDRALSFYRTLMPVLGVQERFCDSKRPWAGWQSHPDPRPLFIIGAPFDGQPHGAGNGQMVAFAAASRAVVDQAYALALQSGGTSEGAPGLRPEYHANYYGAYFRDTEGNKVCVACHSAATEQAGAASYRNELQAAKLVADERERWQSFYSDRQRPIPFFVQVPDENLAQWCEQGLITGKRALDIGCGNARNSIYLSRQGFAVDAVDHSASAVEWAKEEVAKAGASVNVHSGSIFDFAIEAGSYDLVYDGGCFHHMPPHLRADYVALVSRALKPGGRFGLVCFAPEGGSGYSDEDVYERASLGWGLGFDEATLRNIWGGVFDISELRRMKDLPADAKHFGRGFLWVMLARRK